MINGLMSYIGPLTAQKTEIRYGKCCRPYVRRTLRGEGVALGDRREGVLFSLKDGVGKTVGRAEWN